MDSIKLGDLYLSKEESKDIIELLAKSLVIDYIISLKNNLKKKKKK